MKFCIICNQEKLENWFSKLAKSKDGLSPYCKICARVKARLWRIENAEHRRQYRKKYNKENKEIVAARTKDWRSRNPEKVTKARKDFYKNNPERNLWYDAKKRAKKRGVAFEIDWKDIIIPEVCPVLGIKLERTGMNNRDSSPSLDCIIPNLGYVVGNIAVISYRANRIKNDASLEDIKRVLQWLRAHVSLETSGCFTQGL
jgi:hypothetical protein